MTKQSKLADRQARALNMRAWVGRRCDSRRRAVLLPVTLLVLVLLGLIAASGSFYVHADLSATRSISHRFQARMAAEAGLQKVMFKLRTDLTNVDAWYHNPEEYHRVIVWGDDLTEDQLGTIDEFEDDRRVFRFSIVADDPLDDEVLVRYGITDESSKLNINDATPNQLALLLRQFADEETNVSELVDALIDWRDADETPRPFGAETEYYARLEPPYRVKNAPFDTVEEILLVRGFSGTLLYGEDYDRNGLLSPNEDDGDETFPPDDADAALNRGILPYITVFSRSANRTSENKPRTYLFGDAEEVRTALTDFVDDQGKINFIADAGSGEPRIKDPAELLRPRQMQAGGNGNNQLGLPPETVPSPISVSDMIWVMDLLTTSRSPEFTGRVNINTAPAAVLTATGIFSEEEVTAVIEARAALAPEEKRSIGWLAPILGGERFITASPFLTARGNRFHVESMGYSDHLGTVVRLESIIEMRGPIAQTVYNRDITMLGTAYPIRYAEGDSELVGFDR